MPNDRGPVGLTKVGFLPLDPGRQVVDENLGGQGVSRGLVVVEGNHSTSLRGGQTLPRRRGVHAAGGAAIQSEDDVGFFETVELLRSEHHAKVGAFTEHLESQVLGDGGAEIVLEPRDLILRGGDEGNLLAGHQRFDGRADLSYMGVVLGEYFFGAIAAPDAGEEVRHDLPPLRGEVLADGQDRCDLLHPVVAVRPGVPPAGAEDEKVGAESRDVFEVGIGSTFGEDLDTRGIRDLTAQVFAAPVG